MASNQQTYPIGTPGQPWGDAEKQLWLNQQDIKRSYQQEVLNKLPALADQFDISEYGSLDYPQGHYPLNVLKSKNWQAELPAVLVTGGVHGYETSGVQGALGFAAMATERYGGKFNFVIVPCVSPWGYETINRWNPAAIDPNRSFYPNSPAPESALLLSMLANLDIDFIAHFDLHETTDTDNSEFRPALAAREGVVQDNWDIPDGFYTVADTSRPVPEFQQAIVESVAKVTHIAPDDGNGEIIGAPLQQQGVIEYDKRKLFLCGGMTNAKYVTTTEVYPDSPKTNPENCIEAQVAAICGGLGCLV